MKTQTPAVDVITKCFGISFLALACIVLWAALDLPGVTGGSGSVWEGALLLSIGTLAICFGAMMLATRRLAAFILASTGALISFAVVFWTSLERAKEVGFPTPF